MSLRRVLEELSRYEHPLFAFGARENGDVVEITINLRQPWIPVHEYVFVMHPRDLVAPNFEWHFQRQLYDCMHDYFVEMFIRTPQDIDPK